MARLTTNKDVKDMTMYELAHNSCYAKDGNARYRDYDTDIDARHLAVQLLKKFTDDDATFEGDEHFDECMYDYLQYGFDTLEGLIAVFYHSLWTKANLREILKKYEDLEEMLGIPFEILVDICKEHIPDDCKKPSKAIVLTDEAADRWNEYKKLEEQGLLLKLPCKVGDTVWCIFEGKVYEGKAKRFNYWYDAYDGEYVNIDVNYDIIDPFFSDGRLMHRCDPKRYGTTVFLTKEEAEQALQRMKEGAE